MHRLVSEITLGERTRTLRDGLVTIHRVRYQPHWRFASHAHDRANLTFVLAGTMEESAAGSRRMLATCEALLKPAHTVHSNHCGPAGARSLVIELASHSSHRVPYAHLHGFEVIQLARRAVDIFNLPAARMREESDEIIVEAVALAKQKPAAMKAPSRSLRLACDLLHDGFSHPLRVADLAEMVDLHPVYLARAFRRHHGCTVSEYRQRLQVIAAARMLADSAVPLASVALRCGFADQSHLCRAFRRCCGTSPGILRRALSSA